MLLPFQGVGCTHHLPRALPWADCLLAFQAVFGRTYETMHKDIKKAISMVKGVGKITLPRRKRYSSYERSLRDLEEGRVYEAKDVDDLFRQCLG